MSRHHRGPVFLAIALALVAACSERPDASSPVQPRASSTSSISVTSTSPAWGDQGQTSELVTVNGSGFAPGAQAAWALNGVVTSDVQVVSTQYVSSKQLVATVNVASNATLAFYDVQVANTTGTKGIGSDLFEVTQAFAIPGLVWSYGTNDYGMAVGNLPGSKNTVGDPALWIPNNPLGRTGAVVDLGPVNSTTNSTNPRAVDQAGKVIVGDGGIAYYWLKTASGWTTAQPLPHDPSTTVSFARTLASDPVTGNAVWAGGQERVSSSSADLPRMWSYDSMAHSFTRHVMPIPAGASGGRIRGVNANGEGVGAATLPNGDVSAAYWNQSGTAILLPPGGNNSAAYAITPDGGTIAGSSGGLAVYWSLVNGSWTGPFTLPGNCSAAVGIDTYARMIGNGCSNGRSYSAAWIPPYTSQIVLGGLGDKSNAGYANGISLSGKSIMGTSAGSAAGWQIF